jgi:hypothetical protein
VLLANILARAIIILLFAWCSRRTAA